MYIMVIPLNVCWSAKGQCQYVSLHTGQTVRTIAAAGRGSGGVANFLKTIVSGGHVLNDGVHDSEGKVGGISGGRVVWR